MRILPASIEISGDYSRHAHNILEQYLKCTIVPSTFVPFGSAKTGQTSTVKAMTPTSDKKSKGSSEEAGIVKAQIRLPRSFFLRRTRSLIWAPT